MKPEENRPDLRISQLLGNCDSDKRVPDNREIGAFCTTLQARYLAQNGNLKGATALVDFLENSGWTKGDILSENWGINLALELKNAERRIKYGRE